MSKNWHDSMRTGIETVDDDHQQLFALIQEFHANADANGGQVSVEKLGEILDSLQGYARDHFEREEYLQQEARYDGYEDNKRQHDELRRTLTVFVTKFKDGSLGEPRTATMKMRDFLDVWLSGHIVKTDRRMRGRILPWAG